jgi:hypothetical protein
MFLDSTFEEMRGRYLRGYGDVPPEAERLLDGVVTELQELTRDFETFLTGVSEDVLGERVERLAPTNPVANDLRELSRIVAEHGLVDLRPSLRLDIRVPATLRSRDIPLRGHGAGRRRRPHGAGVSA